MILAVKGSITGPVLMWVEALDLALTKMAKANFPFNKVYAISGSGQQHGSVYWAKGAQQSHLKNLDSSKDLVTQLQEAFSIKDSPVWMDSSTSVQCSAIERAVGGAAKLTALTGMHVFVNLFNVGFTEGSSVHYLPGFRLDDIFGGMCVCVCVYLFSFIHVRMILHVLFVGGLSSRCSVMMCRLSSIWKVYWAANSQGVRDRRRNISCNGESVSC